MFVTTPSHGGVYLPPALADKMPPQVVEASFLKLSNWWEEDCDWAWPIYLLKIGTKQQQGQALGYLSRRHEALLREVA